MKHTLKMSAIAGLALLCAIGCKKKKNSATVTPPPVDTVVVYPDYMAMRPGNYWIYQDYQLDSATGAAHAQSTYDSCFVEKDTLIGDKTYHKYLSHDIQSGASAPYVATYMRDSAGYTLDEQGHILFASNNFTDTFRIFYSYPSAIHDDTIKVAEMMGSRDEAVTVAAGSFVTSTFRQVWALPSSTPYGPAREKRYSYARNVGLVRYTTGFYIDWPTIKERRLERYHVVL